jgi:putative heme-binding domain-containing protein
VLLTGFGMEDAHSVANSLTWGPDGWLYGCQGSTVTANVRGIEFQQGVWRYHPLTRKFELFCEGGGNSWGLDFDRGGQLLYSTNVGGFRMLHGVQGGYYWKSFGKHGALHNPHAYGYFDHVPHRDFRGGHVTVGGIVYQGDAFPAAFRNTYITADLLGHAVYWSGLERSGSTFRSRRGGDLLVANDTWFAPSDVTMGPDGAVYVADWHDKRTAHPDPDADWDRSNGRIYRIAPTSAANAAARDLARLPSSELVELLAHPNDWYVRKARRILADRRDAAVMPALRKLALESKNDHQALEALWALYVSGGFDEAAALQALGHRDPDLRRWAVRWLGDDGKISPSTAKRLIDLAATEPEITVRSQLACTAKRLSARDGLAIIEQLVKPSEDVTDPHMPLLLWWALEHHSLSAREAVLSLCTSSEAWRQPLVRQFLLERLLRRYAAEGTDAGWTACARLLASAPTPAERRTLLPALALGLQDRPRGQGEKNLGSLLTNYAAPDAPSQAAFLKTVKVPAVLEQQLAALWTDDTRDADLLRVLIRLGRAKAGERALALALDRAASAPVRRTMLELVGEAAQPNAVAPLLKFLGSSEPEMYQVQVLAALQSFDRPEVAEKLLDVYPQLAANVRARAGQVLLSRRAWARLFLQGIDELKYPAKDVPLEPLRQIALHRDAELDRLVRKHWGNIAGGTPEEKLAEIRRLNNDLRAASGNPHRGRELFRQHCATCHRLFDEGTAIGPDLTHANRKDRDYLLVSIVDPSAVIRKEFLNFTVQTTDGRLLTGLVVEQTANTVTLLGAKNERTILSRDKIESIQEAPVSLMPENLLKELKPADLRDLFQFLQSEQTPKETRLP